MRTVDLSDVRAGHSQLANALIQVQQKEKAKADNAAIMDGVNEMTAYSNELQYGPGGEGGGWMDRKRKDAEHLTPEVLDDYDKRMTAVLESAKSYEQTQGLQGRLTSMRAQLELQLQRYEYGEREAAYEETFKVGQASSVTQMANAAGDPELMAQIATQRQIDNEEYGQHHGWTPEQIEEENHKSTSTLYAAAITKLMDDGKISQANDLSDDLATEVEVEVDGEKKIVTEDLLTPQHRSQIDRLLRDKTDKQTAQDRADAKLLELGHGPGDPYTLIDTDDRVEIEAWLLTIEDETERTAAAKAIDYQMTRRNSVVVARQGDSARAAHAIVNAGGTMKDVPTVLMDDLQPDFIEWLEDEIAARAKGVMDRPTNPVEVGRRYFSLPNELKAKVVLERDVFPYASNSDQMMLLKHQDGVRKMLAGGTGGVIMSYSSQIQKSINRWLGGETEQYGKGETRLPEGAESRLFINVMAALDAERERTGQKLSSTDAQKIIDEQMVTAMVTEEGKDYVRPLGLVSGHPEEERWDLYGYIPKEEIPPAHWQAAELYNIQNKIGLIKQGEAASQRDVERTYYRYLRGYGVDLRPQIEEVSPDPAKRQRRTAKGVITVLKAGKDYNPTKRELEQIDQTIRVKWKTDPTPPLQKLVWDMTMRRNEAEAIGEGFGWADDQVDEAFRGERPRYQQLIFDYRMENPGSTEAEAIEYATQQLGPGNTGLTAAEIADAKLKPKSMAPR
jgi:hypothetical protein